MTRWPDLNSLLGDLPWAVAGAVATRRYMPERATADIDIVVPLPSVDEACRRLQDAGFRQLGKLAIGGSTWESPEGAVVDLIEGREPWWPDAIADANRNRDEEDRPVLTLAYLVLMKLLAGRVQDVADVSRMLGRASDQDLTRVRALIAARGADLIDDAESLIALGRLEWEEGGGEQGEPAP
jgi:hypothetical protein